MQLSKTATKAIADHLILKHQNKVLVEVNQWKQSQQTQSKKTYTGLERVLMKKKTEKLQKTEKKKKQNQLTSQQIKKNLVKQRKMLKKIKQLKTQIRKSKWLQNRKKKKTARTAVVTAKTALKALKFINPTALQ